jgi:UDP-N-acetyl-2-amino-2-deoxyglucuronate dehydrogenase
MTYKVGVVGLGHGKNHVRLTNEYFEKTECVVLCDVNEERLQNAASELGVGKTTTHYADLLSDPDLDILCICSPCHIHGQMVLAALEAGKHVMVETPMENESMERLWKIIRMAERRHLKVQMDCPDRWIPETVKMKQLIDDGKVGEIYYVICEYLQDIRQQVGGILLNKEGFRMGYGVMPQEPVSAGAGIYAIDTARWFLGEQFTEVFAYGNRKNLPMRNVDDHEVALFRTASGAIARVQCSKAARRPYHEIIKSVWGTKGTIETTGYLPAPADSTGLYGCFTDDGAGSKIYKESYEMNPIEVPSIPLPEGVTEEMARKVGHDGVEFFSWLDLVSSIEEDCMSKINVYEAARACAGAIAVKMSKEERRPIPIPQIADRHDELKPLYPLPYEKTSSDEL